MLRITHTRGRRAAAIEQSAQAHVRIGSAPGVDVLVPDAGVMPVHAEIRWTAAGPLLIDLTTPGGTFVGGARITERPLESGDEIALGSPQGPSIRVEILGPLVAAGDGRVDLATAQRMVEAAVAQATGGSHGKAAAIVATKVAEATRRGSRRVTLLTWGVRAAFVAVVASGFFVWRQRRAADVLASEAGIGTKPIAAPKGKLPTDVLSGRDVYDRNKAAVYVIGYLLGDRVGGCCSAFAIGPDLLATNAHCVFACQGKGSPVVTQNESGGKVRFPILAMSAHPGYSQKTTSSDSPDVGLLRIKGTMPKTVTLANDAELYSMGPGDDVFVIGFPGRVMDPVSPSATFLEGHIGRVMDFKQEATTPDKASLIQHDAVTRGGNSGSPVFNQYGHVVAVHAAHIDDEQEVSIAGQKTTVVDASPFRIGMRVDLLKGVPAP